MAFADGFPAFFDTVFTYACFVGFFVAGGVYYAWMTLAPPARAKAAA